MSALYRLLAVEAGIVMILLPRVVDSLELFKGHLLDEPGLTGFRPAGVVRDAAITGIETVMGVVDLRKNRMQTAQRRLA